MDERRGHMTLETLTELYLEPKGTRESICVRSTEGLDQSQSRRSELHREDEDEDEDHNITGLMSKKKKVPN